MYDVITIGSATRDNFLLRKYNLIDDSHSPSGKAVTLAWGEKFGVDDVHFTIGGNAANASVTFARQGFKTACAAKIGKDAPGREFIAQLKSEGVHTTLVRQTDSARTAYSALLVDSENGERTILNHHGASDEFTMSDIDLPHMKSNWWYMSLAGESHKMYKSLIEYAQRHDVKVAFNPSGDHLSHGRSEILESLPHISFLVLNLGEAAGLVGISFNKPDAVFKKLSSLVGGVLAITDGPKGVIVSDGKKQYRAGIFPEDAVRDRTGAGDSFGSGFVAGLIQKQEKCVKGICDASHIKYAIRLASANATTVIEAVGSTENILTKGQFERQPRWKKFKIDTKNL